MTITVEAIFEDGILKPSQPLTLKEHEKVQITIHTVENRVMATASLIPCNDLEVIERIALVPVEDL